MRNSVASSVHSGDGIANPEPVASPMKADVRKVLATMRQFRRRSRVIAVHWGLPRRRAVFGRRPCIVVVVERKRRLSDLVASETFPQSVRVGGKRIRVDVQGAAGMGILTTTTCLPGNHIRLKVEGGASGTLGALIPTGQGVARGILCAHVVRRQGARVTAWDGSDSKAFEQVDSVRVAADVAAANIINPPDWLAQSVREFRDPDEADIGRSVQVNVTWHYNRTARISIASTSAEFATPDGPFLYRNVGALTGYIAEGGDSGAPVILREEGVVIGFVLGVFNQQTYFVHARRSINALPD